MLYIIQWEGVQNSPVNFRENCLCTWRNTDHSRAYSKNRLRNRVRWAVTSMPSLRKFDQLFSKERKDSGWAVCGTPPKYPQNVNTIERAWCTQAFAWRHSDKIPETLADHKVGRSRAILFILQQEVHRRFLEGQFHGRAKKYPPNHVPVNFSTAGRCKLQ